MPIFSDIKQKIRQAVCCVPSEVDQNEGPPPAQQSNTQARQATVNPEPIVEEEDEEEQEEDWGDQEPEIHPYSGQTFVLEADENGVYSSNKSPFKGYDEVQSAFERLVQDYCPQSRFKNEDASLVWRDPSYERPIQDWSANKDVNIAANVQEAR
ncbi:hypothetical protein [Parasitella parasitica]|uniref:Uncharacterized protein n=1 Tax=Parasitella parasitica TaxID=35722 RepID=A0A0B7N3E9_9FUNG|nr:hypothetical protein [Parasitella parasitica]